VRRPIAMLTDFGLRDAYVGVVKGVILARDPDARLVDLCHEVPPQDVRRAALLLATSVQYFASGAIFLVVVDPGVGTERRGVVVEASGWTFVGPDNGVLTWALRLLARVGRLELGTDNGWLGLRAGARAVQLLEQRFWLPEVSSTFHGRDVFGPVAAELSLGRPLAELGPAIGQLRDLPWPEPCHEADGSVRGEVLTTDGFGNLITNLRPDDLAPGPVFQVGDRIIRGLAPHFQSDSELIGLIGSSGFVEIAVPNGSAAALLQAGTGTPVRVERG
jgi:S-adenosylmethionine hydrolase